jgi:prevent-host-death family protein
METVGIRHLKTHLSGYLRRVELGEHILVTDHGRIVAELSPPSEAAQASADVRYQALVTRGVIRPSIASRQRDWLDFPPIGAPVGTAQALIDEDRGE